MTLEPIAANDAIWLQDSATNLMVINAVIITDHLDLRTLRAVVQQRVFGGAGAGRFDRLRCRIAGSGHRRYWQPDPAFDLGRHIVGTRVRDLRGAEGVQAFVGREAGKPLDPDRPLWQVQVVQGFEADTTVLLVRIHHSIGDGEALLGLLFSLVDEPADAAGAPARNAAAPPSGAAWARRLLRQASLPLYAPGIILRRLSWIPDRSALHGPVLSGRKRVAWTRPLDLAVVKRAHHRIGATVNDVLMASVSGAFCHYLEGQGKAAPSRFLVDMPVSVRHAGQAQRCDNHFAPVPLELPAAPGAHGRRILEVKARMDELKCSVVPLVIYYLQSALVTLLPQAVSRSLIDFLANKCTAVVSNIKGPSGELTLKGRRVRSILFWVPQRARIGVGISILSFSGKVQVGVMADEALVPDPAALVRAFEREFNALRRL